jgi:hypothetical protein
VLNPDSVTPPLAAQDEPDFVMLLEDDEDRLDAFQNESPVLYHHIDSVIGEEEPIQGQAQHVLPQA